MSYGDVLKQDDEIKTLTSTITENLNRSFECCKEELMIFSDYEWVFFTDNPKILKKYYFFVCRNAPFLFIKLFYVILQKKKRF